MDIRVASGDSVKETYPMDGLVWLVEEPNTDLKQGPAIRREGGQERNGSRLLCLILSGPEERATKPGALLLLGLLPEQRGPQSGPLLLLRQI